MSPLIEPAAHLQERFIGILASEPERFSAQNLKISGWSYGEHVDHVLKVNEGITRFLSGYKKFPANEPNTLNFAGKILLFLGRLPRGRAKSPEVYTAAELSTLNPHELLKRHHVLLSQWEKLSESEADWRKLVAPHPHPIFGKMNCAQWMRFMEVHMRHHYRIALELLD